ncbi:MAG: ABC transporter ATP-binding protein [Victivallales bacterium]|nr:ABC transporter ATP-binding protein [Victivallales bacterium]
MSWKYIKPYFPWAVTAALFMLGEVLMDLLQPSLMRHIVDDGVLGITQGNGDLGLILRMGALMIGLVLLGGLCGSLNNAFTNYASQNIGNLLRKDCFRKILGFSLPQVEQFGAGTLITRVTNDVSQVEQLVSQFIRGLIRTTMLSLGSLYFLFRMTPRFGMVVLCFLPVMGLVLLLCLRRVNPIFTQMQSQLDTLNALMQEDITGIRIIKACVREAYEKLRFGKANGELLKTQLSLMLLFSFMFPTLNLLISLAMVTIIYVGSLGIGNGMTSPGSIMAATTYAMTLGNALFMCTMLLQSVARGAASWKRLREILNLEPGLPDGTFDGDTPTHGRIELRDVSFSYPGAVTPVLRHVNLTIEPGQTIAVIGATGCGKTTLANLIPRFYETTQGAVLLDGVDVREYAQNALRDKVAFALQKSELFSTTIRENIAWGRPEATNEEIRAAARIAQAEEFILATPDGYDTVVAERGNSLSGGQRQRIAIARAILRNSDILIFDDATSALDLKTEALLTAALRNHHPGQTRIVIAQRIASVRHADRIVVMENGAILAGGTHAELMQKCPAYQEIYASQLGEKEDAVG